MAGPRTHVEMAARAWEQYLRLRPDIRPELGGWFEHAGVRAAFYSGCIFPDWGYGGIDDEAAEDSHWPPFQEELLAQARAQCARPWSVDGGRLMAFALGVVVHGISDDLWHFSRDRHTCFLDMALQKDGLEHGPCERVCEVFVHLECPGRPMLGRFWWPDRAVLEVYARRGFTVTPAQLKAGYRKMAGQWRQGAWLGWLAYPTCRMRYAWCREHYRGDAHGAVEHSARAAAARLVEVCPELVLG